MKKEERTIKKIQELVPEICINENAQIIRFDHSVEYFRQHRPITLEDVLLVLNKSNKEADDDYITMARRDYYENKNVALINFKRDGNCVWQLNKSFREQSDETKDFIGDLLLDEHKRK